MKVKKIQADDMPEALVKVKKELGKRAVILHSREVETGGFLGFFCKKKLEVIAAADPEPAEEKYGKRDRPVVVSKTKNTATESSSDGRTHKPVTMPAAPAPEIRNYSDALPAGLSRAERAVRLMEPGRTIKNELLHRMTTRWYKEDCPEHIDSEEYVHKALRKAVHNDWFVPWEEKGQFIFLAGPTGAGKTTTIAKLASDAVLAKGLKTALITADTYRVAAVEQLKTYAGILGIPIRVVYSPEDFSTALSELSDYDRVYVDTAGRNYMDLSLVNQIRGLTDQAQSKELHLVLPLTGKGEDLTRVAVKFSKLKPDSVIFSKWDETGSRGSVLHVLKETGLKASLITTGQEVPEDLMHASKEIVIEGLTKDGCYEF
ncbi:flagellar biosynthesis protein FlhF [Alteribacter lacisalsi]|uniref:Flagellar biosynthesis protein FlhF n=1 Tax=Alteribacter lacisalsi TaxID=2045244 RepID=A0A2W0H847_9BACI|nr:flagellar biosynthesis protein FlhF [Alteribacter lacisalsi]PYZ98034.1 flagellar biosynthesis protein FlhF [Alteribacter lacisalsi]